MCTALTAAEWSVYIGIGPLTSRERRACTNKKKNIKKQLQSPTCWNHAVRLHYFIKVTNEIFAFILPLAWWHFFRSSCCQRGLRHKPRHQLLFVGLHCNTERHGGEIYHHHRVGLEWKKCYFCGIIILSNESSAFEVYMQGRSPCNAESLCPVVALSATWVPRHTHCINSTLFQ